MVLKKEDNFFVFTNVYGYNNQILNKCLLDKITDVIAELKALYPTDNIMIGGDWKMTPDECNDRWRSRTGRARYNDVICNCITSIISKNQRVPS